MLGRPFVFSMEDCGYPFYFCARTDQYVANGGWHGLILSVDELTCLALLLNRELAEWVGYITEKLVARTHSAPPDTASIPPNPVRVLTICLVYQFGFGLPV